MTNLLDYKKNWDYASEEELTKIYQEQYNDVFSKILLLTGTQFMNVFEKQIITYLYITKRQPILSLLTKNTDMTRVISSLRMSQRISIPIQNG